jgi:hypothetical protein
MLHSLNILGSGATAFPIAIYEEPPSTLALPIGMPSTKYFSWNSLDILVKPVDDYLGPYSTIRVCLFGEASSLATVAPPGPVPTTI